MDVVLWVGVGICLFVIIASAAAIIVAATMGVRAIKAMKAQLVGGLAELDAQTKEMEQKIATLSERSDELSASLDKLTESLRKVSVLAGSTRDARDIVGNVRDFVPKK